MASADKPQTAGHGRNAIVAGLLLALGLGWGLWRLADAGLSRQTWRRRPGWTAR
ncbi:hypothetical protein WJ970_31205 [Achromobacter xylosoxidans]